MQEPSFCMLQDFGASWSNLTEKAGGQVAAFWDFDWGASLMHSDPSKTIDDEVIFATVYEDPSHVKGSYPGWDKDLHFVRSDDLWDSQHTKLVACGNQFEVIGQRVSSKHVTLTNEGQTDNCIVHSRQRVC